MNPGLENMDIEQLRTLVRQQQMENQALEKKVDDFDKRVRFLEKEKDHLAKEKDHLTKENVSLIKRY